MILGCCCFCSLLSWLCNGYLDVLNLFVVLWFWWSLVWLVVLRMWLVGWLVFLCWLYCCGLCSLYIGLVGGCCCGFGFWWCLGIFGSFWWLLFYENFWSCWCLFVFWLLELRCFGWMGLWCIVMILMVCSWFVVWDVWCL